MSISVHTLKKNVEKILTDNNFASTLKHQNIGIIEHSAPKQTETTQRWKIALRIGAQTLSVPTKIEFSRRRNSFSEEIAPPNPHLIHSYKLQSFVMQHYGLEAAIHQKFKALIQRAETQSRDVIDLKILNASMPSLPVEQEY